MKKGVVVFVMVLVGAAIWWLTGSWVRSETSRSVKKAPAAEATRDFAGSRAGNVVIATTSGSPASFATETRAPTREGAASRPAPAHVVQPPTDAPLGEVLAALRSAADLGDVHAACRVGIGMRRCLPFVLAVERAAHDPSRPLTREFMEEMTNRCSGADGNDIRRNAWRYLYRAAAGGNVAAMVEFSAVGAIDPRNPALSADGWAVYRDHAQEFLTRAVSAGSVDAAYAAADIYATGMSSGGDGVFPRDPYLALVYANAVMRFVDAPHQEALRNRIREAEDQLAADRVLQARADATTLSAGMAAAGATPVVWSPGNDGAEWDAAVVCDR